MEAYAQVLTIAIPFFILLVIIESLIGRYMGIQVNRPMDTISSLSSGMTNTLKSLIGLSVIIISYQWMEANFGLFDIKSTLWLYVLTFIGLDFAGYWSHRLNHTVNAFWNRHVIHHSSEEFNLSCALRQEISAWVGIYFFLMIPLAVLGIPHEVIAVVGPLHLFAQFWYHTRLIGKMGFLEKIIVTPSHHRVHHAINDEYLDKNFSEIFILWDKWFGTFQEELPNVPAVYGTKQQANTWNPVLINYMHLWGIAKDAFRAISMGKIWDSFRIWFMPTGWRPEGFEERFPIEVVNDPYNRPKYDTPTSQPFILWSWIQLGITNMLMYYAMINLGNLSYELLLLYCAFLFVMIFSYTTLMDLHPKAFILEVFKVLFGGFLIYFTGGWFGLENVFQYGVPILGCYFALSLIAAYYFSFLEKPKFETAGKGKAIA